MSTKICKWDVGKAIKFMRMKFKEKDWVWDLHLGVTNLYVHILLYIYIYNMNEIAKGWLDREGNDPSPESWESAKETER